MALLVIFAETLSVRPPSAAEVEDAFRSARLGGNERDRGVWVGERARVVRGWNPFSRGRTSVAWLYAWPSAGPWSQGAPLAELARELTRNVNAKLDTGPGGSWEVRALRYDPAIHGAVEWWQSGAAARSGSRDAFPTLPEGIAGENPVGPGDAARGVEVSATHSPTAAEVLGELVDTAESDVQNTARDLRDAADAARGGAATVWPWVALAGAAAVGLVVWAKTRPVRVELAGRV